ncbi:hypothetical protein ANCCEY_04544 [Ancylostoma ceylanicum]|uniref:Uncharacterized protein n=2 Tax=Ancylostoma ceylanicum TaxID=53326 RepID=A0A8I3B349_9BILA|nr:hypothetical protein ANCCEY_04544 [Ancylostoma ceylanicum]EYB97535.1 hypothetical protein Y032_0140g2196 [Ancylostoma ceylanicum]
MSAEDELVSAMASEPPTNLREKSQLEDPHQYMRHMKHRWVGHFDVMMTEGVSASPNSSQETRRDQWDDHRHDVPTRLRNVSDNEVCHTGC